MRPYVGYYETLCEDGMPLVRFADGPYSARGFPLWGFRYCRIDDRNGIILANLSEEGKDYAKEASCDRESKGASAEVDLGCYSSNAPGLMLMLK